MFSEKASPNHSGFQARRSLLQPFNGGCLAPKQPQTVQKWMGAALFQCLCFKTAQAWFNPFFRQQLLSLPDLLQRQVFNLGSLGSRFLNSLKSFAKCCLRVFLFVWAFFQGVGSIALIRILMVLWPQKQLNLRFLPARALIPTVLLVTFPMTNCTAHTNLLLGCQKHFAQLSSWICLMWTSNLIQFNHEHLFLKQPLTAGLCVLGIMS